MVDQPAKRATRAAAAVIEIEQRHEVEFVGHCEGELTGATTSVK
jgi:hypothetical protein